MNDIRFTKTHEWVCLERDETVTVGITDHAQHMLGDIVFVELPNSGDMVSIDKECAVVESVKSASDIYAPLTGEVVEVNHSLVASPEIINSSPQENGWLFKIRPSNPKELENLMDIKSYEAYLAKIAH